jgi:outer membrane protein TolC
VRQGVARNQMLPELNLNTAYGFNGLGMTPGDSWEVAQSQDFPSWSVGLELSVPLAGNIKGRNLLYASKLKLQEAYVNLKAAQTEMANGLITSLRKANAWQQSIQSYRTIEEYDQALLNTQLARLKAGTVEAQKVLDVEKDLLNAHQEFANALVQYQRTLLQVALNAGTILNKYNLDITRDELRQRTAVLLKRMDAPIAASTY